MRKLNYDGTLNMGNATECQQSYNSQINILTVLPLQVSAIIVVVPLLLNLLLFLLLMLLLLLDQHMYSIPRNSCVLFKGDRRKEELMGFNHNRLVMCEIIYGMGEDNELTKPATCEKKSNFVRETPPTTR